MTAGNGDENSGQLLEERAFWKQMFAAKPRTIVAPDSLERAKRRSAAAGQRQVKFSGKLSEKADYETTGRCKENGLAFACCSIALADLEVDA
jgi:hypothetical protein